MGCRRPPPPGSGFGSIADCLEDEGVEGCRHLVWGGPGYVRGEAVLPAGLPSGGSRDGLQDVLP
eukprot:924623-Alexandrium_andersonii.AAC.1